MTNAVIIRPNDSVVTVIREVKKGERVEYPGCKIEVRANSDIPIYHKVAIVSKKKGEKLFKYGESIGYATRDISVGDYVHEHNLNSFKPE